MINVVVSRRMGICQVNVIIVMFGIFQYYGDRVMSPEFVIEILM